MAELNVVKPVLEDGRLVALANESLRINDDGTIERDGVIIPSWYCIEFDVANRCFSNSPNRHREEHDRDEDCYSFVETLRLAYDHVEDKIEAARQSPTVPFADFRRIRQGLHHLLLACETRTSDICIGLSIDNRYVYNARDARGRNCKPSEQLANELARFGLEQDEQRALEFFGYLRVNQQAISNRERLAAARTYDRLRNSMPILRPNHV